MSAFETRLASKVYLLEKRLERLNATIGSALVAGVNGWAPAGETWTYASATTFTISGDKTAKYAIGDKVKCTQTTDKYFYVVSVSYGAPNTTVTVAAGSSYSLANAAITSPYWSKANSPQGFPQRFSWTPTWTGFSVDPSVQYCEFWITGRTATCALIAVAGTSNATDLTITNLPVTPIDLSPNSGSWKSAVMARDNGAFMQYPGQCSISHGSATATFYPDWALSAWTNSGGKFIWGQWSYPI